jgi:hypothetical protein
MRSRDFCGSSCLSSVCPPPLLSTECLVVCAPLLCVQRPDSEFPSRVSAAVECGAVAILVAVQTAAWHRRFALQALPALPGSGADLLVPAAPVAPSSASALGPGAVVAADPSATSSSPPLPRFSIPVVCVTEESAVLLRQVLGVPLDVAPATLHPLLVLGRLVALGYSQARLCVALAHSAVPSSGWEGAWWM